MAMPSIAVVGCGRLGLTMALVFASKGCSVYGVDISSCLVEAINNRTLRTDEPGVTEALLGLPLGDTRLTATTSLGTALAASETVLIAVDTPSTGGDRHYDHTKVGTVLAAVNAYTRGMCTGNGARVRHVVVCCTVMPGYLVDVGSHILRAHSASAKEHAVVLNITAATGDTGGADQGLLYNPLFIAQGEIMRGLLNPVSLYLYSAVRYIMCQNDFCVLVGFCTSWRTC
eukprot:COSAG05_NODE_661_length_8043_cov_22.502014_4_plen_229_part_00